MLRDGIIASIRTGVAFVVTWLVTKALGIGAEIDTDTAAALSVALFGLGVVAYNFVVGQLERRVHPLFGVLLGVPKAPQYGAIATPTPSTNDGTVVAEAPAPAAGRGERGASDLGTTLIGGGVLSLVAGLVLDYATRYDALGNALVVLGVVLLAAGVILAVAARRSGTRL